MKTRSQSSHKVWLAFGSAVLSLLVVGAISYHSMVLSTESNRWVRHTHEVIERVQNLLSAMQNVDTSVRGFLLTGEESYSKSYRAYLVETRQDESIIRKLTSDNSIQQGRLLDLEKLVARRAQLAETGINLRRTKGLQAAADISRSGAAQQIMDEFEATIREMQIEERRLLALRIVNARRLVAQTRAVLIVGAVLGFLMAVVAGWSAQRDNSKRNLAENALFVEKERAQVTLRCIGDAVLCTDVAGLTTFLNLMAEKMTGWTSEEAIGQPMVVVCRILDGASREAIPDPMEMAMNQDQTVHIPNNCVLIRRDGFEIPVEDSVSPIHSREGRVTGAVIVFRNVSAAHAMALQMTHSAHHDFLTGLPNRMLLNDRVNQAIILASRHSKKVAVLFLDLDGFKHINDSLGHPVGDRLLQSIANRLVGCVRSSDTVSRQGGDEFVVLLSEIVQSEDAAVTACRMLQVVAEAHSVDQRDLHVTTSVGISVFPDDGMDAETLIKNADTAMYQAKENGRHGYQFFKAAMNVRAVERQSTEEHLRRALDRNEFVLHYQPKIKIKTGEITGAEALIRWMHPTRGLIGPVNFISVAEDCGLILPIGNWVLREAC